MTSLLGLAVRRTVLPNGLVVLTAPRRVAPVVALRTWYAVGSRDEAPGEGGTAHFLEHMMFKGSRGARKGEIDRLTQLHGGLNNACTTCDATAYEFDLPAEHLDVALGIEADRMRGLLLDPSELEAERAVILEEIQQAEDEPEMRILREADRRNFGAHGYGHSILGSRGEIEACTVDRLRRFYDRWYAPDHAALALAGDFDEKRVLDRVRDLFGAIEASTGAARANDPPGPQEANRRVVLREDVEVARFHMQFRAADGLDPRADAIDLLARVLGGGRSSRLHRRLVDRDRLLASVRVSNDARSVGGVLTIDGEGVRGTEPERIEAILFEEIHRLQAEGCTPDEISRARNGILAETVFRTETAAAIAEDAGESEVTSSLEEFLHYPERITAVTGDRVRAACSEWCVRGREVAAWSVPR